MAIVILILILVILILSMRPDSLCALILSETLALYKSFAYLLTYLPFLWYRHCLLQM